MLLKACLNGAHGARAHPALPVTAARLGADVLAVRAAGADAVHLHVKDESGTDTLDPSHVAETLTAVRAAADGVPIGVTTGAWAQPDPAARVAMIRAWTELPDFASVNWHEDGAEEVARVLMQRGVGVEAGLWHHDAVLAWGRSPIREECLRVLVELPDGPEERTALADAGRLLDAVAATGTELAVLLHGAGSSCWPVLREAARLGLSTRIGLEDTLVRPDGLPARDNAELVRCARELLGQHAPPRRIRR